MKNKTSTRAIREISPRKSGKGQFVKIFILEKTHYMVVYTKYVYSIKFAYGIHK